MVACVLSVLTFSYTAAAAPVLVAPVTLVTFDGAPNSTYKWEKMDDPVMGGQSRSSWSVGEGAGHFNGTCAIVPFLHAPGFCRASTFGGFFHPPTFANASDFKIILNPFGALMGSIWSVDLPLYLVRWPKRP